MTSAETGTKDANDQRIEGITSNYTISGFIKTIFCLKSYGQSKPAYIVVSCLICKPTNEMIPIDEQIFQMGTKIIQSPITTSKESYKNITDKNYPNLKQR